MIQREKNQAVQLGNATHVKEPNFILVSVSRNQVEQHRKPIHLAEETQLRMSNCGHIYQSVGLTARFHRSHYNFLHDLFGSFSNFFHLFRRELYFDIVVTTGLGRGLCGTHVAHPVAVLKLATQRCLYDLPTKPSARIRKTCTAPRNTSTSSFPKNG